MPSITGILRLIELTCISRGYFQRALSLATGFIIGAERESRGNSVCE